MILLDTDVMVDILRGFAPAIDWLQSSGTQEIGLPGLVVMELLQGCQNSREQRLLERNLRPFILYWPNQSDCMRALVNFSHFHLSQKLGMLDSLIAETALGVGAELATFNTKHYTVLNALKTIQPYQR
jgi:predicted nucleic acid-binding protein